MWLFVFNEFEGDEVLCDEIHKLGIDVSVEKSTTKHKFISEKLMEIYKKNAKLFYQPHELENVDKVLEILETLGFEVTDRNPYTERIVNKTIEVEDEDAPIPPVEVRKCTECGHETEFVPKRKTKEIVVKKAQRKYYKDRVILKYTA